MGLINKEEIKHIHLDNLKEIYKIIEKFLDWKILPKFISTAYYAEIQVNTDVWGLHWLREDIQNKLYKKETELEFEVCEIWNNLPKYRRYQILLDLVTYDLKVERIEVLLQEIFWIEYNYKMIDIILNHIDSNWNFIIN